MKFIYHSISLSCFALHYLNLILVESNSWNIKSNAA